jgi:hypothetical protein
MASAKDKQTALLDTLASYVCFRWYEIVRLISIQEPNTGRKGSDFNLGLQNLGSKNDGLRSTGRCSSAEIELFDNS